MTTKTYKGLHPFFHEAQRQILKQCLQF